VGVSVVDEGDGEVEVSAVAAAAELEREVSFEGVLEMQRRVTEGATWLETGRRAVEVGVANGLVVDRDLVACRRQDAQRCANAAFCLAVIDDRMTDDRAEYRLGTVGPRKGSRSKVGSFRRRLGFASVSFRRKMIFEKLKNDVDQTL